MSLPTPETHPSRQVERIREILVGRQMENVERRLEKLENRLSPLPTPVQEDVFAIRLENFEQRHDRELRELREHLEAGREHHGEEVRRLAGQIQAIARSRSEAGGVVEAQAELEARIGRWLQTWQTGISTHQRQREEWLIAEFRSELQRLREWVRQEIATSSQQHRQSLQASFSRMAAAAHELAEAATAHGRPPTSVAP